MGWILGDKFNKVFPHKGSIRVLWETKWKFACEKSVYPFHDGNIQDFAPIFEHLIKRNINDALSDDYTKAFIPVAESLEQRASTALDNGDSQSASELLLRAAVVYRISRFPYVGPDDSNGLKRAAYDLQKKAYLAATSFWPARMQEHFIPFTHRSGTEGTHIPIYVRVPNTATLDRKVPCILILTGLDGYRPDNSQRTHEILKRGWGVVICEIPGTADSPADPADPASPDRLLDSILQYMASRPELDMSKIVIWGLSAGGFYAVRAAHTHSTRLAGCIAHGPGIHHFLDAEWLSRVEDHEYPFPIVSAWAKKYGYDDPDEFRQKAQEKFSLIRTGIVDQPSCRLLLLNGMDDGITPIEDCLALFTHGTSKEGRFYPGLPHMGYPDSLVAAYKWLDDVLGQNKCSHLPN